MLILNCDISSKKLINVKNNFTNITAKETPSIQYNDNIIIRVQFFENDEPFALNNADTFELGIDNNFNHDDDLMALSNTFSIIDAENGIIQIPIATNTISFKEKVKTSKITANLQIKKYTAQNLQGTTLLLDRITALGSVLANQSPPTETEANFYNKVQINALLKADKSKGNFLHNGEGFISQRGATSTASNTPRFIDDRFYYLPINPTATIEATNAGTGEISVVCSDGNFICRQPQTAKDIYYIFGQHFTMFSEANNILTHKIILIKNDDTEEIINGVTNSDGSTTFDLTAKNTADFQTVYFDFTSTTPTANIKYRHANIGENFTGKDYKNRTLELLNCQPYYFQIHFTRAIALSSFSVANGGNASSFPVYFPTEMRTTPTFHTGMWQYYDGSNFVDSSTIHSQVYDNKMTLFRVTSHNNENKMILPKMNEDGILSFDAEIIDGS